MDKQTVIFFGVQGSGKGTQVKHLEKYIHEQDADAEIFHYETGAGFRAMAENNNLTSKLVKDCLDKGQIIPVFLPVSLWANAFVAEFKGTEHIFIDGFPRRVVEAEVLDSALGFYKRKPAKVIVLELSDEDAMERLLLRGRHDDTKEGIAKRLSWYHEEVEPILEWYRSHEGYDVIGIDGCQGEAAVHESIKKELGI